MRVSFLQAIFALSALVSPALARAGTLQSERVIAESAFVNPQAARVPISARQTAWVAEEPQVALNRIASRVQGPDPLVVRADALETLPAAIPRPTSVEPVLWTPTQLEVRVDGVTYSTKLIFDPTTTAVPDLRPSAGMLQDLLRSQGAPLDVIRITGGPRPVYTAHIGKAWFPLPVDGATEVWPRVHHPPTVAPG